MLMTKLPGLSKPCPWPSLNSLTRTLLRTLVPRLFLSLVPNHHHDRLPDPTVCIAKSMVAPNALLPRRNPMRSLLLLWRTSKHPLQLLPLHANGSVYAKRVFVHLCQLLQARSLFRPRINPKIRRKIMMPSLPLRRRYVT